MFKSILLAGFFWATANFMPASPVTTQAVIANTLPSTSLINQAPVVLAAAPAPLVAKPPVLMASVPRRVHSPKMRMVWEMPVAPTLPVSPNALTPEEQEFIEKVNSERTGRGLNSLIMDPLLVHTARAHSREMCARDYFDHHSPTSGMTTPMDRYLRGLQDAGGRRPDYLLVGENIYYCSIYNDVYNVDYGHRALMDSPGHRANILEPRFTKVGMGIYRNAKGEIWVTQMFTRDENP